MQFPEKIIFMNTVPNDMSTSWECIAFDGERVPHGENFVPGPDNCTACKCEKGEPRFCRAALCQPPLDCKSFRVGDSCCDFICLDDILPPLNKDAEGSGPSSDAGLRLVASAITAILSLSLLLFLIHRLRQRRLRTAQHQYFEDQLEALGGLPSDSCRNNPCCHSAIYLSGNDHVDFFLDGHSPSFSPWKPPSYFQHGDAPPPYSEVVASDRARAEGGPLPSLNPLIVQLTPPRPLTDNPRPQRTSIPQRQSLLMAEAISAISARQQRRGESGLEMSLQANPIATSSAAPEMSVQAKPVSSSALLSDQMYENASYAQRGQRVRPRSLHNPPPIGSLNDLNRGTVHQSASDVYVPPKPCDESCPCECAHNLEKCNVCSGDRPPTSGDKNPPTRPIQQEPRAPNSIDAERASVVEDFRLRLRLDISSSSTSNSTEGASQPFSLASSSSGSSEDAPSIESAAEATC